MLLRGGAAAAWFLCVLLGLLLQTALVRGGLERYCTLSHFYEQRRQQARTSCSRHLPERLRTICGGRINIPGGANYASQMLRHRRAADGSAPAALDDGVFLDRQAASVYLHKRQAEDDGGIQGIVCECCIFPCKRREMQQYCANGAPAKRKRSAAKDGDSDRPVAGPVDAVRPLALAFEADKNATIGDKSGLPSRLAQQPQSPPPPLRAAGEDAAAATADAAKTSRRPVGRS